MAERTWTNDTGLTLSAQNLNALEADLAAALPRFRPTYSYVKDTQIVSPTGEIVTALANFTSGATYNAANWKANAGVTALTDRVKDVEDTTVVLDGRLDAIESSTTADSYKPEDLQPRLLVGARASELDSTDETYFKETHDLEKDMNTKFDMVSWYRSISSTSDNDFISTVVPELAAHPERKVLYCFEIKKSNMQFNKDFEEQNGIYPSVVNTLLAIKNSGYADRVYIAPFHEGNGGGGPEGQIGAYPWQMYDTNTVTFNGVPNVRVNTPAEYKKAFRNVVTLMRELEMPCKVIQWFLASNTGDATDVDGIDRMDMTPGYAGDDYVDIIGLSYYNRSKDLRYGDGWPQPGASGLREFYNAFERMTSNPLWICEAGCAASNEYGDKGQWYADLIKLGGSTELPRLQGICMFLQDTRGYDENGVVIKGANMRLDSDIQKGIVGRAINSAKRTTKVNAIPTLNKNLLPIYVSDLIGTKGWTYSTGVTIETSSAYTPNLDKSAKGMRITKPGYVPGDGLTKYNVYRKVDSEYLDYVPNDPYTLSFYAQASFDGFKVECGMRQNGGDAYSPGDELSLTPYWEQYVVAFSSTAADLGSWRIPNFNFGSNKRTSTQWFEIAGLRLSRGAEAQPNVERLFRPRIGTIASAPTLTWFCENRDIYTTTLSQDSTLLPPEGAAHDGQELILRIKQGSTGGKVLTLGAGFLAPSAVPSIGSGAWARTTLKFQYDADAEKWGLVSNSLWNVI